MEKTVIAALATPPGTGAVGMIRASGEGSLTVLQKVFFPLESGFSGWVSKKMCYGAVRDQSGAVVDLCMAVFYCAPSGYTGEDGFELFCHGGMAVLASVLEVLYDAGARPAQPGEFSRRAFLNGKMDLFYAEAVIDLITAETAAAAKNAAAQLSGKGADELRAARRGLLELIGHFYAEVDFPDEGVPPLVSEHIKKTLAESEKKLRQIFGTYARGRLLKEGISVAIMGRPNVGKSSLLNRLCGKERAIVTEVPGTTRDVVDARFIYRDRVFQMHDTAGIRETLDRVERIGVARALEALENAQIALIVLDGSAAILPEDGELINRAGGKKSVIAVNKSDISALSDADREAFPGEAVWISAETGAGIDTLCGRLLILAEGELDEGASVLITNERQAEAVSRALSAVCAAKEAADSGMTFDVLLSETETAVSALGEITGENTPEDVVNDIFSRFCVGK